MPATSSSRCWRSVAGLDQPAAVGGQAHGPVAGQADRRRVGAVGRVRDENLARRASLAPVPRPHDEQAGQLARRSGRRLKGGGVHPGDAAQGIGKAPQQRQPALGIRGRCGRVGPGQPGQRRRLVADLGVVLHGARPQRVSAQVDRVLAVGQPGHVGDEVALGDLGQDGGLRPQFLRRDQLFGGPLGHARGPERRRPPAGHGEVEDRRLGGVTQHRCGAGPAPGGGAHHATTFSRAAT